MLVLAGAVLLVAGLAAGVGPWAALIGAGVLLLAAGLFGDFDPRPAPPVGGSEPDGW